MREQKVPEPREITLEQFRLGITRHLADECMAGGVSVEVYRNLAGEVMALFRAKVYGESHDAGLVRYPKTWWDHFKQRFFPLWALQRWPVRYECVTVRFHTLYPDFSPPDHPDFERTYRFVTYNGEER